MESNPVPSRPRTAAFCTLGAGSKVRLYLRAKDVGEAFAAHSNVRSELPLDAGDIAATPPSLEFWWSFARNFFSQRPTISGELQSLEESDWTCRNCTENSAPLRSSSAVADALTCGHLKLTA